jgi:hypothetical protein
MGVQIAQWLDDGGKSYPLGDLSVERFRDLVNALRNIRHLDRVGKDADGFITREGSASKEAREAVEAAAPLKDKGNNYAGAQPARGELKKILPGFFMGQRKVSILLRYLDGMKDFGAWWRSVYKPMYDACNVKESLLRRASENINAAFVSTGWNKVALTRNFNDKMFVKEWEVSLSKMDMVTIALNMGSESNLSRLLSKAPQGFNQSEEWRKENWDSAEKIKGVLANYLTETDFKLAGMLWQAVDFYAEYDAMVLKVMGFHLPRAESVPMEFKAKGGKVVYLPGGYWPLKRDRWTAELQADEVLGEIRGAFPYPDTGAATQRADGAKYSVDLTFGNIYGALERHAQDIAFRPAVLDVNKFMRQAGVAGAVRAKLGDEGLAAVNQWLAAVSSGKESARAREVMDTISNFARSRTVMSSLLCQVTALLRNFANFTLYGNAVEGFGCMDSFKALWRYGIADYSSCLLGADLKRAKELRDYVWAKSAMMRGKREAPDFTLKEMQGAASGGNDLSRNFRGAPQAAGIKMELAQQEVSEFGGELLGFTDSLTDIPMWLGAYGKAIAVGKSEEDAVACADTVIERATGTGRRIDTSAFQRGSPGERLLSMFTGFFNTAFNRWADEYHVRMGKPTAARIFKFMFCQYLGFGLLSELFSLKWPGNDGDKAEWFVKEVARWPLSMTPVFGAATSFALRSVLGDNAYASRLSPMESHLENITRADRLLFKEDKSPEEKAEAATAALAFALKYPDRFNDWFWNAYEVLSGNMEFELGDLARRRTQRERR